MRLSFFETKTTPALQSEFVTLMDSVDVAWNSPGFKVVPLVKVNVIMHLAMMAYVNQSGAFAKRMFPRKELDWVVEEFDQRRRFKLVVYAKSHPVLLWRHTGTLLELSTGQLSVVCDMSKQLGSRILRNALALAHKVPAVGMDFYQ